MESTAARRTAAIAAALHVCPQHHCAAAAVEADVAGGLFIADYSDLPVARGADELEALCHDVDVFGCESHAGAQTAGANRQS